MLPTLAISLIVLLLAAINAITGTGRRVLGHAGRTVRPQLGTVAACLGRCRCAISALLHATPSFLAVAGMRACTIWQGRLSPGLQRASPPRLRRLRRLWIQACCAYCSSQTINRAQPSMQVRGVGSGTWVCHAPGFSLEQKARTPGEGKGRGHTALRPGWQPVRACPLPSGLPRPQPDVVAPVRSTTRLPVLPHSGHNSTERRGSLGQSLFPVL